MLTAILSAALLQVSPNAPPATSVDDVNIVGTRMPTEAAVQLECNVAASGRVTDCVVLSEDPPGRGFGEAALQGARRARLTPGRVNGVAQGGKVRFTMRFRTDG